MDTAVAAQEKGCYSELKILLLNALYKKLIALRSTSPMQIMSTLLMLPHIANIFSLYNSILVIVTIFILIKKGHFTLIQIV